MERWERMLEIFELLEGDDFTVRELTDTLERKERTITLNLVDFLLRHYNKNGYLRRYKNFLNVYSYSLSKKGKEQLKWLENGCQYDYLFEYEENRKKRYKNMDLREIEKKLVENIKERAELELAKLRLREAEKERELLDKRRKSVKLQTQVDHQNYLLEQQRLHDQKEYEKSDMGRTERAKREASENIQRDFAQGLTDEEIRVKYMDSKERIKYFNERNLKQTEAKLKGANSFLSDMY
jgi:hypothetical protein